MARVQVAAPISGIAGKVGGLVFSHNGTSSYCRAWAKPRNPRTSYQTWTRSVLSQAPNLWRNLSSAQRSGWDTYAAAGAQALTDQFGSTYYASGFNWFTRINAHRLDAGQAILSTAPAGGTPATPTLATFVPTTPGTGTSQVTYASGHFSGYYLAAFVARNPSQGFLARSSRFRLLDVYTSPGATSTTIQTQINARFPGVQVGERYTIQVYRQSTEGRRSAPDRVAANVAS